MFGSLYLEAFDLTFSDCSVVCVLLFLMIILLAVNMVLLCVVIVSLEVLIVVLPKGDRAKVVARSNMSIVNAHSFDMTRSAIDNARSTKHQSMPATSSSDSSDWWLMEWVLKSFSTSERKFWGIGSSAINGRHLCDTPGIEGMALELVLGVFICSRRHCPLDAARDEPTLMMVGTWCKGPGRAANDQTSRQAGMKVYVYTRLHMQKCAE